MKERRIASERRVHTRRESDLVWPPIPSFIQNSMPIVRGSEEWRLREKAREANGCRVISL